MKIFGKELKFNNNKVYHSGDKPTFSDIGAASKQEFDAVKKEVDEVKTRGNQNTLLKALQKQFVEHDALNYYVHRNEVESHKDLNGYQCMPQGLIYQWGYVEIPVNAYSGTYIDIISHFPKKFNSRCVNITFSMGGRDNNWISTVSGHALDTGLFRMVIKDNNHNFYNIVYWTAIGY